VNHLDVFEVIAVGRILSGGRISGAARKILTQRRAGEHSSPEGGGLRVVRLGMLDAGHYDLHHLKDLLHHLRDRADVIVVDLLVLVLSLVAVSAGWCS
jgi:hypothetical protein